MPPVQKQRKSNAPKRPGGVTGKGFKPGQSGNPGGRPKGRTLLAVVRELLSHADEADLKEAAAAFIGQMKRGSFPHLKEYIDREDGKVAERIAGDDGGPLKIIVKYVDSPPREANA